MFIITTTSLTPWGATRVESIFSTGGSTYEHRLPAALYEMHETEEQANIYSLQMAKKWIDDRG